MLDGLSNRLSGIMKTISGNARLSENNISDALREVRVALLEADVNIAVVKDFIEQVKLEAIGQKVIGSLKPDQAFIDVVNQQLTKLMGQFNDALNLKVVPPAIILMAGLQGAGKTTTLAKLAYRLKTIDKKKVLVVSTDIYRPAAMTQLQVLAESIAVDIFPSDPNQQPLDIATQAHQYAKNNYFDVLIIDTAGRTTIDEFMMNEIKQIHQAVNPIETLFVVDSMLGQNAVNTAQAFNTTLSLTGIILTKMDGDARGGCALSIRHVTGKPIKFIGISEKITGLEPFYPDRLASRILGMGDILSLIDQVKTSLDTQQTKKMIDKMQKGKKFTLEDLREQFSQVNTMGGMENILDKMPNHIAKKASNVVDDKIIKRNIAIINSMTMYERHNPDILKASRKKRIATGSGVHVQYVNQLLKQYEQISTMMKKFGNGGMARMMQGMRHLL